MNNSKGISYHVYDLELNTILKEFIQGIRSVKLNETANGKPAGDFIEHFKSLIGHRRKSTNTPAHSPLVIQNSDYDYQFWLTQRLMFLPFFKIHELLDWHAKQYPKTEKAFQNLIEFQVIERIHEGSMFDNSKRVDSIHEWLVKHKEKSKVKTIRSELPELKWDAGDSILKDISNSLFQSGLTTSKLSFYHVFKNDKKAKWKGDPAYLVYLIHRLIKQSALKVSRGKGHFSATISKFSEYSGKLAEKNFPHYLLNRITKRSPKSYAGIRKKVDLLMDNTFKKRE